MGSGKSTYVEQHLLPKDTRKKQSRHYLLIDADKEKEKIMKEENISSINEVGLHQKSIKRKDQLIKDSVQAKKNFVYVASGRGTGELFWLKDTLKQEGYRIKLLFVTTNLDTALKRCAKRERVVPLHIVEQSYKSSMRNFEKLKGEFHTFLKVDANQNGLHPSKWPKINSKRISRL
jgi:predicted kinase